MTLQYFYVWMGCHFFMAGFEGTENKKMWWSEKPFDIFKGVPFSLSDYISGQRFHNIVAAIRSTNIELLAFLDLFHYVRHVIYYFNEHYDMEYVPS